MPNAPVLPSGVARTSLGVIDTRGARAVITGSTINDLVVHYTNGKAITLVFPDFSTRETAQINVENVWLDWAAEAEDRYGEGSDEDQSYPQASDSDNDSD
jgi:hypothetical protein